jgi:hypothetical protein
MYDLFGHVPSLILTGPRLTGKTLFAELSAAFIAINGENLCVSKDSSLAAIRKRGMREHLPLIIHDPQDDFTVLTALQEMYEGKKIEKADGNVKPSSSITITMNEGLTNTVQSRYRATCNILNEQPFIIFGSQT